MADDDQKDVKDSEPETAPLGEGGMELPASDDGEERRDVFDLGLDSRSSFRLHRKTVRHYVAHAEYGVIFSFCGIRTTRHQVEMDPAPKPSDIRCEKCKATIWQEIASANYAKKMKDKKDLGD